MWPYDLVSSWRHSVITTFALLRLRRLPDFQPSAPSRTVLLMIRAMRYRSNFGLMRQFVEWTHGLDPAGQDWFSWKNPFDFIECSLLSINPLHYTFGARPLVSFVIGIMSAHGM